jgi:hypothetical protein
LIGQGKEQAEEAATSAGDDYVTLVYGETYIFLDIDPKWVTTDMFMLG